MASAEELAARANSAFVDDQFQDALRLYSEALSLTPSGQLYSKRAATYLKLGRAQDALDDTCLGLQLDPDDAVLHLRKGLALIEIRQFVDAEAELVRAKALGASDSDRWIERCHLETEGVTKPVSESEGDCVQIASLASKIRESFYDNRDYLSYTIYTKNLASDQVHVEFVNETTVMIKLTMPDQSVWQKTIQLFSSIIPSQSKYDVTPFKVSLTLQKKHPGEKWDRLDQASSALAEARTVIEQYPTSNKKKQNWSSLEKQVADEEEKEQPDGDQALNRLFQQIYANASDDTKRAMIKSYQTSGGTVLSTNWDEVKDKNYEANVEAPSGMEVHRWNS